MIFSTPDDSPTITFSGGGSSSVMLLLLLLMSEGLQYGSMAVGLESNCICAVITPLVLMKKMVYSPRIWHGEANKPRREREGKNVDRIQNASSTMTRSQANLSVTNLHKRTSVACSKLVYRGPLLQGLLSTMAGCGGHCFACA